MYIYASALEDAASHCVHGLATGLPVVDTHDGFAANVTNDSSHKIRTSVTGCVTELRDKLLYCEKCYFPHLELFCLYCFMHF
jgi:hypothetical protein